MPTSKPPIVVAVSGASGCGKTTMVTTLANSLNADKIHFDDFIHSHSYPSDMQKWLFDGADVSLIDTPAMANLVSESKQNSRGEFLFVEEPFGKQRESMKSLIDKVVLLDMPMEICLARVINRHIRNASVTFPKNLLNYLEVYEAYMRDCYLVTTNQVRENCDLVVTEDTTESAQQVIIQWLETL